MKTLKALREEMRVFNLDTDEELDLEALADMDLDSLLGDDGFGEEEETEYTPLDFNNLADISIDDYIDDNGEYNPDFDLEDEPADFDALDLEGEEENPALDLEGGEESQGDIDIDSFNMEDGEEASVEDQDFQGEIRTVRGANLVYKRKAEDGNYEELWIYNVGNDIKRETQIRRAILAGTDIDPGSQESKDGSQRAETTTAGNVQFLHIEGLPQ